MKKKRGNNRTKTRNRRYRLRLLQLALPGPSSTIDIGGLTGLHALELIGCAGLAEDEAYDSTADGPSSARNVTASTLLGHVGSARALPAFALDVSAHNLTRLVLERLPSLARLEGLPSQQTLIGLLVNHCPSLTHVGDMSGLAQLNSVVLADNALAADGVGPNASAYADRWRPTRVTGIEFQCFTSGAFIVPQCVGPNYRWCTDLCVQLLWPPGPPSGTPSPVVACLFSRLGFNGDITWCRGKDRDFHDLGRNCPSSIIW
jgi:hypothetical protein